MPFTRTDIAFSAEFLRALVHYDPDTGVWTWIKSRPGVAAGKKAGFLKRNGYFCLGIGGSEYQSSRLAFLYLTGEWPAAEVDHIDRDPSNDRWANLRLANRSENNANKIALTNNKLGVKGVCLLKGKENNPYQAQIKVDGKPHYLGCFNTADEAGIAYEAAAKRFFGEFARAC